MLPRLCVDTNMVKIFIGNLPDEVEKDEIEALFTQHGTVTECAKFKNYAFVHMDDRKSATKAIRSLHLSKLHGRPINVEPSRGKNQGPVKLHVANVEKGDEDALSTLFEEYGTVTECVVVKNFAFVHMSNSDEAKDAIQGLDNSDYQDILTFSYQKDVPDGRKRITAPHQIVVHTGQHLMATLWTGGSLNPLITEVACQGGTLASLHHLPLDEPHTHPSVPMRGKATRWWITMRSTELALPLTVASQAMEMRGALAPYPHHHPLLSWLGRALRPPLSTRMSVTPSHLCPTTPVTAVPSGDPLLPPCPAWVTATPMNASGSLLCPGLQCTTYHVPGTPTLTGSLHCLLHATLTERSLVFDSRFKLSAKIVVVS
ncbi:CUGBP Elav-like family member 4 isoform X3 [Salmo salar]|uniref:CUGBP Elav-like family member 4 isoform X3 n=1 Tax=Salmo salar TaxID=8030 RepID=A0A1S3N7M5_SALSA|nr:CUGBP Elav-like family member 4 isoform X3 [Salmo salar]|eukprot:XP_014011478.1 PREDICTED: CUGBP Elav-like family member 4 isoform X4 [Salmo salar]